MRIEVRIVPEEGRENVSERDRQVVHVETHTRRNDAFNVQKVDDIHEGHDLVQFAVPNGGRLVLNTPFTGGDVVYDPEQAAAIRSSQQQNDEGRADKVDLEELAKQKQADADLAKRQAEEKKTADAEHAKSQGAAPVMGTQHAPPAANPARSTPNPSTPSTPAQTPPQQKK